MIYNYLGVVTIESGLDYERIKPYSAKSSGGVKVKELSGGLENMLYKAERLVSEL